jgi:hypothetical protein
MDDESTTLADDDILSITDEETLPTGDDADGDDTDGTDADDADADDTDADDA